MSLSDTFYVALCMTVLIVGVVYWFWTQNQYIQRKLNLLENIVYEMKTSLNAAPDGIGGLGDMKHAVATASAESELKPAVYPPAPGSELGEDEDLLFEELHEESDEKVPELHTELESESGAGKSEENIIEAFSGESVLPVSSMGMDDLQPGGIGSGINGIKEITLDPKSSVLDSMTLKELRRLAEQKGVSNAKSLKKHELITAIRLSKVSVTPFEVSEGTLELS